MTIRLAVPAADIASRNFAIAKVLSILVVAAGHYFEGSLLWIPSTVALFIFGFSSGYFTGLRYREGIAPTRFWGAKIMRLLPAVLVIDAVLLALFIIEGRTGLWTLHSLVAASGLSGWFDWLGVRNDSPFGAGLWFFTLLLMFYFVYPVLRTVLRTPRQALTTSVLVLACATALHYTVDVGHMLWPTAAAFILGAAAAGKPIPLSGAFHLAMIVLPTIALGLLNTIAGINQFNYALILLISIAFCGFLLSSPLPSVFDCVRWLEGCVLEIYFLHTYLFVRPDGMPPIAGWLVSMILVIAVSRTLWGARRRLFA
jgi:hypothetical protein